MTLWQVGHPATYASTWALMQGHQTRCYRANSIFSAPKWPPNALSCSSQSTISWKPPLAGSTSTSESFRTWYKVGFSPPHASGNAHHGFGHKQSRGKALGQSAGNVTPEAASQVQGLPYADGSVHQGQQPHVQVGIQGTVCRQKGIPSNELSEGIGGAVWAD